MVNRYVQLLMLLRKLDTKEYMLYDVKYATSQIRQNYSE